MNIERTLAESLCSYEVNGILALLTSLTRNYGWVLMIYSAEKMWISVVLITVALNCYTSSISSKFSHIKCTGYLLNINPSYAGRYSIVHLGFGWDQNMFHPMWHRVLEELMFIELVINFLHFMKPEGSLPGSCSLHNLILNYLNPANASYTLLLLYKFWYYPPICTYKGRLISNAHSEIFCQRSIVAMCAQCVLVATTLLHSGAKFHSFLYAGSKTVRVMVVCQWDWSNVRWLNF